MSELHNSHRKALPKELAVVGEDVIVNKPGFHMHDRIGEIWKVKDNDGELRVSVSFDGEIFNFTCEELVLA